METVQRNPFTREDTFFGVCQALGDDFRFNPIWLRLAFAAGFFFNPVVAVGAYAALGLVVLATRLIVPNPRSASTSAKAAADEKASADEPAIEAVEAAPAQLQADNETVAEILAVAA